MTQLTATQAEIEATKRINRKEGLRRLKLIEKELRENESRGFWDTIRGEPIEPLLNQISSARQAIQDHTVRQPGKPI